MSGILLGIHVQWLIERQCPYLHECKELLNKELQNRLQLQNMVNTIKEKNQSCIREKNVGGWVLLLVE